MKHSNRDMLNVGRPTVKQKYFNQQTLNGLDFVHESHPQPVDVN